jgi:hypothetical protein
MKAMAVAFWASASLKPFQSDEVLNHVLNRRYGKFSNSSLAIGFSAVFRMVFRASWPTHGLDITVMSTDLSILHYAISLELALACSATSDVNGALG